MKIDGKKALELLEEVVAEKGEDYKYEYTEDELLRNTGCRYFTDTDTDLRPRCIIGHVFAKLTDDTNPFLSQRVAHEYDAGGKTVNAIAFGSLNLDVDQVAVRVWQAAQSMQDSRLTWGKALAHARETLAAWSK